MAIAKTVTLFLMDGSPSGRIKCSLTNWIGRVYLVPRTDLPKCKDRPELNQTGIYLLFGTDENTGDQRVYVGQARGRKNGSGVLGRIVEHIGDEKMDYFTHAVIIITSDDSLGPTEISYLENAFYHQAMDAARIQVVNGNDPSPGKVTEEKQAELDEFISFSKVAIGSLGYRLFDQVSQEKDSSKRIMIEESSQDSEPMLYLASRDISARGQRATDGFVVFAGSYMKLNTADSFPKSAQANRLKYADRVTEDGELTQDILFGSPSAASNFLLGFPSSGTSYWKNQAGVSLGELESARLEANAVGSNGPELELGEDD